MNNNPTATRVSGTIKALEWHDDPENCGEYWFARAWAGVYCYEVGIIDAPYETWWWQEDAVTFAPSVDGFPSKDAAKAAAQADYDARILAAIQSDPEMQRDPTNPFAPMERPGWTEPGAGRIAELENALADRGEELTGAWHQIETLDRRNENDADIRRVIVAMLRRGPVKSYSEKADRVLIDMERTRGLMLVAADRLEATPSSDDTVSVGAAVWQPIETAPKDGAPILTYSDDCAKSETQMVMWWSSDKAERCGFGWEAYEVSHMLCPTHWMPLPNPPAIAGKNAREGQP